MAMGCLGRNNYLFGAEGLINRDTGRDMNCKAAKMTRRNFVTGLSITHTLLPANLVLAQGQHLPVHRIKEIIQQDIENGQYYVTGNLTKSIYSGDCRFIDPTTNVKGVDNYVAAIRMLFDPAASKHELTSIDIIGPNKIMAKWRLQGYLKFFWRPHIKPYEGTTVYTVNNGLIVGHEETWNISLLTAFLEFLTPSFTQ